MKVIGVIPARYGATRFPGKSLAPILGKPMIQWVLEGASESRELSDLVVATDSELIKKTVIDLGFKSVMTRGDHPSGTDRVWEVAERYDCTHVLNIQGDEPLLKGRIIDKLLSALRRNPDAKMATMSTNLEIRDAADPNRVKVVVNESGRALYFSRSMIPNPASGVVDKIYLLHIGIYLYEKNFLRQFIEHGPAKLESIEKLEQLRALEMGASIDVIHTDDKLIGVDSPEDIAKVEKFLKGPFLA